MSVSTEESKCLSAIVDSITLGLQEEPLVEGRIADLLSLIPELLCAELSERRVVYLLSTCKPLPLVVRLIHPSLQSSIVNLAAMNALLDLLTWCVELPRFLSIEPVLSRLLLESDAVQAVLDALICGGNEAITPSAAVLLFVLVARMPSLGDSLNQIDGAVGRLCDVAFHNISPSTICEYVAGVLRVCAELDFTRLPSTFIKDGLGFIISHYKEDGRVVVLVAECIEILVHKTPDTYLNAVAMGEIKPLGNILEVLRRGEEERRRTCLLRLFCALLGVEGGARVVDVDSQTAAYKAVLYDKMWVSQELLLGSMFIVLSALESAMCEAIHVHILSAFVRAFPVFCRVILEGPTEVKSCAVVAFSLALAKNPQVRASIRDLTRHYAEWSLDLMQSIASILPKADVTHLAIVDVTGTVMNDPVVLPQPTPEDWSAWADAALTSQERREPYNGHTQTHTMDAARRVRSAPSDDARVMSCTIALLFRSCERSVLPAGGATAQRVGGYEEWLVRNSGRLVRRSTSLSSPSLRAVKAKRETPSRAPPPVGEHAEDKTYAEAVLCFLPLKFGVYFRHAQQQPRLRKLSSPSGVVTQKLHRPTQGSWCMDDVHAGEMYSLFVPFRALTVTCLEEEAHKVEHLTRDLSRRLVTTPTSQRGRRWFLTDMVNHILPGAELLLRDLLDMLQRHGPDGVVYQLGLIRLLDAQTPHTTALADIGVPYEVTILSQTVFRDVVHSANLVHCVARLRQRFSGKT